MKLKCLVTRTGAAGVTLLAAVGLACSAARPPRHMRVRRVVPPSMQVRQALYQQALYQQAPAASSASPGVAAAWTLPGANLQNTRDVASAITVSNVGQLGVAWCVPIESTGEAQPLPD